MLFWGELEAGAFLGPFNGFIENDEGEGGRGFEKLGEEVADGGFCGF